jgi:ankyrin repeat protein
VRNSVEIFDELIAHGARLEDSLALHHAAATRALGPPGHNDTRLMARLLELGVDINEPDDKGKPRPGSIGAPIFWAMRGNQIANMKFLIENGADLTVKTPFGGRTPLEHARARGYTEVAEYLESLSPRDVKFCAK